MKKQKKKKTKNKTQQKTQQRSKKNSKQKKGKIIEQILAVSTLIGAIGSIYSFVKPLADFALAVLFK